MVLHACNSSYQGGKLRQESCFEPRRRRLQRAESMSLHSSLGDRARLRLKKKICLVQCRAPVIPATQEAEAGELPEPRRRRLRWAEITPLHATLGNKSETLSQKKYIYILSSKWCSKTAVTPQYRAATWDKKNHLAEKWKCHLTQQSHYCIYIQRNGNHSSIKINACVSSLQHHS